MILDPPATTAARCPACGGPLDAAASGLCPRCLLRGMLARASPDADDWAAEAGYLVLEKIGEGGMAEVFLAEQYAPLRREVALKRLKAGLDGAEWLRRFDREREALARLDHRHIAHVLDAGLGSDGRPFYALELIDGLPLTLFCDRRRLGLETRLQLFAAVCDAVQHAHQKGVIHGDIKPSNILVATDEAGAPEPRIIDFGVLRATAGMNGAFGTPGYASPEQWSAAAALDARSDVFSLGALLGELAGGLPPEEGRSALPGARVAAAPDLPALAAKRSTTPGRLLRALREDIDWIVRRATAPLPDDRYPAASDLAAEARRFLALRPVAAAPRQWRRRAGKFVRRNARALALSGIAAAILLAAAALAGWQVWAMRRAHLAVAESHRHAATERARGQLTAELVHRLAGALAVPEPQREHHLRAALDHFGHELDAARGRLEPEAEFALRQTLASAWRGVGGHGDAERELLEARRLAPKLPGFSPGDMRVRLIDRQLALARQGQGRFDEAAANFTALLESAIDGEERRELLFDLASLHFAARRFDDAERPSAEALALATEPGARFAARHLIARLHVEQRRYREARALFRELADELPPGHPRTDELRAQLAEVEEVLRNMEQ